MNKYQLAFIFGCSLGAFYLLKSAYENQFKDGEWNFEYNEEWLGDLCLLREDK